MKNKTKYIILGAVVLLSAGIGFYKILSQRDPAEQLEKYLIENKSGRTPLYLLLRDEDINCTICKNNFFETYRQIEKNDLCSGTSLIIICRNVITDTERERKLFWKEQMGLNINTIVAGSNSFKLNGSYLVFMGQSRISEQIPADKNRLLTIMELARNFSRKQ